MKTILVINPNASEAMTESIRRTVEAYVSPGIAAEVIRTPGAPKVLESFKDYTQAGWEVLAMMDRLPLANYDGILLACFGDPCLAALKEASSVPLVGIAEASMAMALLIGYKFSILAAVDKARAMMDQLVLAYGLKNRLATVESLQVGIDDFMEDPALLKERILERGRRAKGEGCEVLIYGCAGMTMLSAEDLSRQLGMSVLDPVVCGLAALEGIISKGLAVSKTGLYR